MPGRMRLQRSATATTSTSIISVSASGSDAATRPSVERPALLTKMSGTRPRASTRPRRASTRRTAGQVRLEHLGSHTEGSTPRGDFLQFVAPPCHERQAVAPPGELSRYLFSDS